MIIASDEFNRVKRRRPPARLRSTIGIPMVIGTDTQFVATLFRKDEFEGDVASRKHYEREARRAGVNPNGKHYSMQLAQKPADPEAWIGDKGDVEHVCKKYGHRASGSVTVTPPEELFAAPDKRSYKVADDLVESEVDRIVRTDAQGDVSPRERADLKDKTAQRLAGKAGGR